MKTPEIVYLFSFLFSFHEKNTHIFYSSMLLRIIQILKIN
jgi:hypothetical protein